MEDDSVKNVWRREMIEAGEESVWGKEGREGG